MCSLAINDLSLIILPKRNTISKENKCDKLHFPFILIAIAEIKKEKIYSEQFELFPMDSYVNLGMDKSTHFLTTSPSQKASQSMRRGAKGHK